MRMLKKLFCTIIFSFTLVFNAFADDCIGENNGTPSPTSAVSGLLTWDEMEAAGIITGSGSSWAPTSETMDDYLAGQEWSVTFDNGIVNGYAGCTATGWKTTQSYSTISSANAGCACSLDKNTWWFLRKLDTGTDRYTKTEYCRANCPAACANEVATNATFRDKLFNNACPVIQQTPTTQYTINYDMDGGTGCSNTTYTDSAIICTPTRDGYTFEGWMDNNTSDTYNGGDVVSHVNLDLFAFWTIDNYAITYNLNEGTGCSNSTYTIENYITLCTPTRDGYIFDGWYDNVNLTGTAVATIPTGSIGNKEYWAKWETAKFTVTTTQMTANDTFKWTMSAAGTFYVDCGDDGVLSGTGVSGKTIDRTNNTSRQQYTCSYTNSGTHTIKFGGAATGYNSTDSSYAAIRFGNYNSNEGNTPTKIAGISGSLGAIFGTIGNGDTLSKQPCFARTFDGCSNLTGSIPENLFAGISGAPAEMMFFVTFQGCSGLTGSIPENLFAGISGAPAEMMFYATFYNCSGLTGTIPANLFGSISGAPAQSMFSATFHGCSGLTGSIPENLFAGISGAPARSMFASTFAGCTGLSGSIPENLFAGISGAPAEYMFPNTFSGCSGLTGSIPENLFAGITGAPATMMFASTFDGCSGLTGFTDGTTTISYVPASFLSSINTNTSVSTQVSSMFYATGLADSCPKNTYNVTRAQFNVAGKPWCTPCPTGTHYNGTGATSVNQCCPSGSDWDGTTCALPEYTITYNLNGGTGCSNTTYTDSATLCTPTRDGYIFNGWYDNVDLTGTAITEIASGSYGNKTFYAKWTPITYTITYFDWVSANQTEVRMENLMPTTYTIESPTITLPTPTKDGFTFAAWYDKNNMGGDAITTIPTGSTGDKVFYVTWDQITCEPGYYVPAGANGCVSCDTDDGNYYCPGGVFNRSTEEVGRNQCPEIVDYGHAVMYGLVDGDGFNCYATFLYANGNFGWFGLFAAGFGGTDIDSMVSEIAQPSYDANSKMNQIADNLLLRCKYNPDTGLYDKCIIDYNMIFGVLTCKNGYYTPNIPQNINASNLYSDSVWKSIAEYENICVPAQRGYYTTLYDAVTTQINNEIQSSGTLDPNGVLAAQRFRSYVGSIIGVDSSNGNLTYEISDTFGDLGNFVAACPTAYPDSEPASWKKAQCFATIRFNTNGGNQIPDQRFYYNNSGKYAGAYEIYSSPLAMVSKNNYDNVTEDCRYYPTNSNDAISTDCSNAIFSDMANREWKIQHFDGFAKGTSHCSVTSGTNGDFGNPSMESGNNCWCKMTAWIDENNDVIEQNDTQWVLMQSNASDICPNQCAALCAYGAVLAQLNNQSNPIYNGAYTSLSVLSELPTPSKSGAVFAGWYDNPSFAGDVITENSAVSGNRTLYAKWTALPYTITFNTNEGVFPVGVVVPETYTVDSDTITLPVPMLDGYTFDGWYENAELTGDAVSEIPSGSIGNKTYYAKWTRNEFVCESGIWLHIGDEDKVCMYGTKPDAPTMVVETQNGRYYMMLTEDSNTPIHKDSNKKMRVEMGGRIYNVYDGSVNM